MKGHEQQGTTERLQEAESSISHLPYRIVDMPQALSFISKVKLSRLHRHIFLLLDGQHSEHDLVRLTGHPLNEVKMVLSDLARIGLIRTD